ncbi:MAG: signal peptidase II [Desulfopila sp.]
MLYFGIVLIIVALDQMSKLLVVARFSLYDSVEVIPGFFNLVYVTNRGAAFSILAEYDSPWRHYFFVSVSIIAIIVLTVLCVRMRKKAPWQSRYLALIAGGAMGNFIDRIRVGEVIDFIDIYYKNYHWPAFNVADSAICIGVVAFMIAGCIEKERS